MGRLLHHLCGGLLLAIYHPIVANEYARICQLNTPLVTLEFDPISGQYYSTDDDTETIVNTTATRAVRAVSRRSVLRGTINDRKLDYNGLSSNFNKTYFARSCPCDPRGLTFCLVGDGAGHTGHGPDMCGAPWSKNSSSIFQQCKNASGCLLYEYKDIGCFELSSQTIFARNAWPVVFLWYGALSCFLLFTSNGKFARTYLFHLACPSERVNEDHVTRILARENDIRDRLRLAAMYDEDRRLFLVRTRGVRVSNRAAFRRPGMTDEEARLEQAQRWIAQAGIDDIPRPQVEFILKTKKFSAEKERARKEHMHQLRVESMKELSVDLTTPKKDATNKTDASTPKTVCGNESDDDEPAPAAQNDEDTFECTICLTEIEDGDQVGVLPCTHIYHVDCLKQWLKRKNACPLCQITDIASPRRLEFDSGDNASNEENAVSHEERIRDNLEANGFTTRALVEAEMRSYQDQRRRRHRRRERLFETYQL